jgi:hypothetical protein
MVFTAAAQTTAAAAHLRDVHQQSKQATNYQAARRHRGRS